METEMSTSPGNIIKQQSPAKKTNAPSGIVKREIIEAKSEAQRLVSEARTEAAALIVDAERSALETHAEAYKRGIENALAELNANLIAAHEIRDRALAEVEADVLRLAVRIAEKIIGRKIDQNDATIADIVAAALQYCRQNEMVTVRVNPVDLPIIQKYRAGFEPGGRVRFIDFAPDPRVARGGCLIVTETSTIDAQLDTQLRALEQALLAHAQSAAA